MNQIFDQSIINQLIVINHLSDKQSINQINHHSINQSYAVFNPGITEVLDW